MQSWVLDKFEVENSGHLCLKTGGGVPKERTKMPG